MLPIHLAIGVVEGLATAALVDFLRRARPELLDAAVSGTKAGWRQVMLPLTLAAAFTGGVLSWFASSQPDGLEWSVVNAAGAAEAVAPPQGLHAALRVVQQRLAWLPDYALGAAAAPAPAPEHTAPVAWPDVNAVTTLAGLVGGAVTFALVMLIGLCLRRRRVRN
jgi:cobalt/nickel transport system permease protein